MGCVQDVGGPLVLPQPPPSAPTGGASCLLSASSILPGSWAGWEDVFSPVFPPLLAADAPLTPPPTSGRGSVLPQDVSLCHSLKVSSWADEGGGPCPEAGDALGRPTGGHLGPPSQMRAARACVQGDASSRPSEGASPREGEKSGADCACCQSVCVSCVPTSAGRSLLQGRPPSWGKSCPTQTPQSHHGGLGGWGRGAGRPRSC